MHFISSFYLDVRDCYCPGKMSKASYYSITLLLVLCSKTFIKHPSSFPSHILRIGCNFWYQHLLHYTTSFFNPPRPLRQGGIRYSRILVYREFIPDIVQFSLFREIVSRKVTSLDPIHRRLVLTAGT